MEYIKNNLALYFPLKSVYALLQISPTSTVDKKPVYPDLEILEQLLKKMSTGGIELYLTMYPYPEDKLYSEELIGISEKVGITYLNIFPFFTEPWENYHWKKDGHFNEKGHLQAATGLYELLNPYLCGNS